MTLQECYARMHGDYDNVKQRLLKDERIVKYLLRFPHDGSMSELDRAVGACDKEASFIAAHTLKGVAANLGMTELSGCASELTEQLRSRNEDPDTALYNAVRESYKLVISCIDEFSSGL